MTTPTIATSWTYDDITTLVRLGLFYPSEETRPHIAFLQDVRMQFVKVDPEAIIADVFNDDELRALWTKHGATPEINIVTSDSLVTV